MLPGQHYQVNPSVVCTEFGDEAVLLNVETKYYYHLNETGLFIWSGLCHKKQLSAIVDSLVERYEVDEPVATHRTFQLTQQLCEEGLLTTG
jgi:hypothetical protein